MWAEVSSLAPHLLHNGLSSSPSRWRCLLRVLCLVRRPFITLDWVLLKVRNLALVPRLGPKISSIACLWVLPRPGHFAQCWLANQRLSLFCMSLSEVSNLRGYSAQCIQIPPTCLVDDSFFKHIKKNKCNESSLFSHYAAWRPSRK